MRKVDDSSGILIKRPLEVSSNFPENSNRPQVELAWKHKEQIVKDLIKLMEYVGKT